MCSIYGLHKKMRFSYYQGVRTYEDKDGKTGKMLVLCIKSFET